MAHDHESNLHRHGDHDHGGLSDHGHAPQNFGKAFALGILLNAAFVAVEVVYGVIGHSVALIADGGHNLSDTLSLGVAWVAVIISRRKPTRRFTYGLGSTSILAALFNAVFLLVVTGGLTWEAIQRLWEPQPVAGKTVMLVAACGVVLNGFCAWLFASDRQGDLNVRGAFVHMAADALVSLGVVAGGLIILLTGWLWIDVVMTLAVNAVIVAATWNLLARSLAMSLNAVPANVDLEKMSSFLLGLPEVKSIHDLHVWSLSTTEIAMTCHLVMPDGSPGDEFTESVSHELRERFGIGHATLQVERNPSPTHLAAIHSYS